MLAVSNTSTLSNPAAIGRLDLLKSQFSEVRIPSAVARELAAHPDPTAIAAIHSALREWIRIVPPKDTPLFRMLRRARRAGLSITGTLGVLLRAKRGGRLETIRPEIQALRNRKRFFLSASLEAEVLSAARE